MHMKEMKLIDYDMPNVVGILTCGVNLKRKGMTWAEKAKEVKSNFSQFFMGILHLSNVPVLLIETDTEGRYPQILRFFSWSFFYNGSKCASNKYSLSQFKKFNSSPYSGYLRYPEPMFRWKDYDELSEIKNHFLNPDLKSITYLLHDKI